MLEKYIRRVYKPFHNRYYTRKIELSRTRSLYSEELEFKYPDLRDQHDNIEDQIKAIGLRILEILSALTDSLDINFALAYGTMLGAVRHKGFIPWDDDIDIFMTRKDFNVLLQNCSDIPESLLFAPMDVGFFKVMDRSSIISKDQKRGVAVDVFIIEDHRKDQLSFYNVHTLRNLFFNRKDYNPLKSTPFEQLELKIPSNSDWILSELYGDYMKLPPKDQQVSHHSDFNEVQIANFGEYLVNKNNLGN
ncbi:MAG: LicD family protein [Bacteroidota bacterium]